MNWSPEQIIPAKLQNPKLKFYLIFLSSHLAPMIEFNKESQTNSFFLHKIMTKIKKITKIVLKQILKSEEIPQIELRCLTLDLNLNNPWLLADGIFMTILASNLDFDLESLDVDVTSHIARHSKQLFLRFWKV